MIGSVPRAGLALGAGVSLLTFVVAYLGAPPGALAAAAAFVWTMVIVPPQSSTRFWSLAFLVTGLGAFVTYSWFCAWSPEAQRARTPPLVEESSSVAP